MKLTIWCAGLLGLSIPLCAVSAKETLSEAETRSAVAVTVYNDSLALIKEQRPIVLERGRNDIAFRGVSAHMRPETASLRSLSGSNLRLVEQNFDFDLLTPEKLLDKYVGRSVTVIRTNPATGAETSERADVLAANNGVVLRYADRIETGLPGRIAYSELPANLRDRPTLVVQLESATAGEQNLELSYLSKGLSWRADYVAELSADEKYFDVAGWVTLTNQSGASYSDAHLQLVAGDVNLVREMRDKVMMEARALAAPAAEMASEPFFEYHLYTLQHPTTLKNNQTKQVALLAASKVPVRKEYLLEGQGWYYHARHDGSSPKEKVKVFVEFDNQGGQLGIPLPKGVVRVYKKDKAGHALFVGEDAIEHTAKNEKIRLALGHAFDVSATRVQKDYRQIAGRSNPIVESSYRIELANAKDTPVTVQIVEPMSGDWQILSESYPHHKSNAHSAVWKIDVPAEGRAMLEYSVRSR